jgi:hypothetical protein
MAFLRRLSDGAGDSGSRVEALKWDEKEKKYKYAGNEPIVGCNLLVGSLTARSFSAQDYWLTTEITEILEKKEGYIKFKTTNSVYEFKD